ncbi:zinc ribbon domain-containing protein [Ruoffia sp. FAM 24228]|uniref:zinc ribbon domain-containing protein n=1 Tax=unclassified Ruoffia TaxID=2862149 RepID=UPI0038853805
MYQGKYALSGKVICEHCGDIFRRVKWNSRGSKATVWRFVTRLIDHTQCQARTVKEELLHEAVVEAINNFIGEKGDYLKVMEENITEVLNDQYDETVEEVDDQLHGLQKKLYQFANQKTDYERIAEKIFQLREKKQQLLIVNATNEEKRRRLSDIKAFLKPQHIQLEDYDESLVNRLVAGIVIKEKVIEVELRTGDFITIEK